VIDSFEFLAPLHHDMGEDGPLYGGKVRKTSRHGEIEWDALCRHEITGSHESKLTVRTVLCDDFPGRPCVYVQAGVKVFQGHNLFGTDDLAGLIMEALDLIVHQAGVQPSPQDLEDWRRLIILVKRVDPTYMYDLGTNGRAKLALKAIQDRGRLKYRGGTDPHPHGLIFGKGSRRWSLMLYLKFLELLAHPLPVPLQETSLATYADGKLRIEPRLRALELKERGLHILANWGDSTASDLHSELLGRLNIAEADMIEADKLSGLSGRLQVTYQAWADGHDLRGMLPRRTFYRYRAELLEHGVDIASTRPRDLAQRSNVTPLRLVFEANRCGAPDWAIGTPMYFEPRRRFG
jgi:II/X family phage/plasmid replication protein